MEELLELLKDVRDDVDFENCTDLIDGKILSSFDIIQIISVIDEEYDVEFRGDDIRNSNTIEDLYNIVKERVE